MDETSEAVEELGAWTIPELENEMNVSRASLYRWLASGHLHGYRLPGGREWRIPDAEFKRITRLSRRGRNRAN